MAKKEHSFAAKVQKGKNERICPVCEKNINPLLLVKSVKSDITGAWKFNKKIV